MLRVCGKRLLGLGFGLGHRRQAPPTVAAAVAPVGIYHERVVDQYINPRKSVETGLVGAPACGDATKLQIKVDDQSGKIVNACFKTFGCRSTIASSSGDCRTSMLTFRHSFSTNVSHLPAIADPDIEAAFKDLMAMSWDEIPDSVVHATKKALSKATDDKAGQEALANVFRAAEAGVEFGAVLVSLRMALDDLCGLTGENVGPLPKDLEDAMKAAYKRYMTYLDSFGPDEAYLRKKVEIELGTKMIHLKMRCSGIGSEWGQVTLLGTSGLSGSYVEYRA